MVITLTTHQIADLMLRDRTDGRILGLEIKKLIQQPNGSDSRGLTLDYNSCIPS